MKFERTLLEGVVRCQQERVRDERGFFARTFCVDEFAGQGLATEFIQFSTSFTARRGSVRGMHFQTPPHEEIKLIRCTRGAIWDVIVDIRRGSPSYRHWQGFDLSAENGDALYVPAGFAHGFQTLTDDAEVFYMISALYVPGVASGIPYDDPSLGINWPLKPTVISKRDTMWSGLA